MSVFRNIIRDLADRGIVPQEDFRGDVSGFGRPWGVASPIIPIVPSEPVAPVNSLPVPLGATPSNPSLAVPAVPLPVIVTETETTAQTIAGTQSFDVPIPQPVTPSVLPLIAAPSGEAALPMGAAFSNAAPQSRASNSIIPLALGAAVLIVILARS